MALNDMERILLRQDGMSHTVITSKLKGFYVWSDYHIDDVSIIEFSNRPFWFTSDVAETKIPFVKDMNRYIYSTLKKVPSDSFILNLGDFANIKDPSMENEIIELNNFLHGQGKVLGIVLGNHDYLSDSSKISYRAWAGHEVEFYKRLGFDYVFIHPVVANIKNRKILFTHKPVREDVFEALGVDKQYFGHLHKYDKKSVYFSLDDAYKNSVNCCVDVQPEPLKLPFNQTSITFTEKYLDNMSVKDPWVKD